MERHFTYTQSLFEGPIGIEAEKFAFGLLLGLLIFIVGKIATSRISNRGFIKENLIPDKKFSLFDVFDLFTEGFLKFHDFVVGKENRKYFSLNASLFLFILLANLLGLIPGFPAITTTVWVNVGLAIAVFIAFNVFGVKEHGVKNYLKHFAGGDAVLGIKPLIPVAMFLFVLEVISLILRVITLNLRMYWNITADHLIISTIGELTGNFFVLIGPILLAKGVLVSVLQAGVFTVLTMVYILLATQHEEEEH
jgi:F-type H+-transporting ATPase subunit a